MLITFTECFFLVKCDVYIFTEIAVDNQTNKNDLKTSAPARTSFSESNAGRPWMTRSEDRNKESRVNAKPEDSVKSGTWQDHQNDEGQMRREWHSTKLDDVQSVGLQTSAKSSNSLNCRPNSNSTSSMSLNSAQSFIREPTEDASATNHTSQSEVETLPLPDEVSRLRDLQQAEERRRQDEREFRRQEEEDRLMQQMEARRQKMNTRMEDVFGSAGIDAFMMIAVIDCRQLD